MPNERSEKSNTQPDLHALGWLYISPSLMSLRHGCINGTQGGFWLTVRQQMHDRRNEAAIAPAEKENAHGLGRRIGNIILLG